LSTGGIAGRAALEEDAVEGERTTRKRAAISVTGISANALRMGAYPNFRNRREDGERAIRMWSTPKRLPAQVAIAMAPATISIQLYPTVSAPAPRR